MERNLQCSVEYISLSPILRYNPEEIKDMFYSKILFNPHLLKIFYWNRNVLDFIYTYFKNINFDSDMFLMIIKVELLNIITFLVLYYRTY